MSSHRILHDSFQAAYLMTDPGDAGTITVDRDRAVCPVVTATTETRTLAQPTKAGIMCMVVLDTDGGDLTMTVTGGYNNDDDTSVVLDDAGDFILFVAIKEGANYYWRVVAQEGTSAAIEEGAFDSLTVTTANATTATVTNATLGRVQITSTAVNAAGSAIGNAANLSYGMNIVAGADNAKGVKLPVAVANGCVEVMTTENGKQLFVYPQVNSAIAGLGASNPFNTGVANTAATAGTTQNVYFKFVATNATQWYASK
jgi:hypothetical protein